jgi:hypothetical protein
MDAVETSLLCHHEDFCGKPATHVCAGCGWHYCGDHFLRASFTGPGLPAPVVFDTCHACLALTIQQQQAWGRKLSQWHRVG